MHSGILVSRFIPSALPEVGERVGEHFSWSAALREATMRAMTPERNRATILRFFREVIGLGDLDVLDALATEDYQDYVALPGQGPGRAGLKHRIAVIRAAFQPRHVLHDVIVDSDRVAVRWTLQGVHSAEFLGLRPTGKPVHFDGIDMYQMRNGRMAAHWNVVDMWSFYQQVTSQREEREEEEKETTVAENENSRLIGRYYEEVLNQGRVEVLDTIAQADHIEHDPLPGQAQGREGLKQRVNIIKTAFNPQFTLEHVIAESDKVAVMWSNRGTHLVEWFGVPPTGKTIVARGIDIHLIRDGRMAEHWDVVDMLSILIQIGALPAPKAVPA
jgi:steroid delta-isomerase-like uncharacterized protein